MFSIKLLQALGIEWKLPLEKKRGDSRKSKSRELEGEPDGGLAFYAKVRKRFRTFI